MTQEELFASFDSSIDTEELSKQEASAAKNDFSNMPEVPDGEYVCSVQKMELRASKKGKPMVSIQFKITTGKYAKRMIFYNQVIDNGYGLHNCCDFLKNMELDCVDAVEGKLFKSFTQFGQLVLDAYEEIDTNALKYDIQYTTDEKGFHNFEILGWEE